MHSRRFRGQQVGRAVISCAGVALITTAADYRGAPVILDAAERVERAHADLVGGVGVYRATASHGPFAHVHERGNRVRWGLL